MRRHSTLSSCAVVSPASRASLVAVLLISLTNAAAGRDRSAANCPCSLYRQRARSAGPGRRIEIYRSCVGDAAPGLALRRGHFDRLGHGLAVPRPGSRAAAIGELYRARVRSPSGIARPSARRRSARSQSVRLQRFIERRVGQFRIHRRRFRGSIPRRGLSAPVLPVDATPWASTVS